MPPFQVNVFFRFFEIFLNLGRLSSARRRNGSGSLAYWRLLLVPDEVLPAMEAQGVEVEGAADTPQREPLVVMFPGNIAAAMGKQPPFAACRRFGRRLNRGKSDDDRHASGPQRLKDCARRRRLIERIKMDSWGSVGKEFPALLDGVPDSNLAHGRLVSGGLQLAA